jgi:hypothetical protein
MPGSENAPKKGEDRNKTAHTHNFDSFPSPWKI